MQATFEARIKNPSVSPVLDAIAELYGRAERNLFVDRYMRGRPLVEVIPVNPAYTTVIGQVKFGSGPGPPCLYP